MNKHIELVKKWLDDKDSVTVKELRENTDAAYATYHTADESLAYHAAAEAADAAYQAAYWVKRYEELTEGEI
tara:strand:+ start:11807 stop:12022 length:216 start_codon:yes stop_codon:yes gene_type:complete